MGNKKNMGLGPILVVIATVALFAFLSFFYMNARKEQNKYNKEVSSRVSAEAHEIADSNAVWQVLSKDTAFADDNKKVYVINLVITNGDKKVDLNLYHRRIPVLWGNVNTGDVLRLTYDDGQKSVPESLKLAHYLTPTKM